jgi:phage terminase large subunit
MLAPIPLHDPFVRGLFKEPPDTLPGMIFFNDLEKVIADIRDIQADEKNPNDCAKQPHEVTHSVDMVRYFAVSRVISAGSETKEVVIEDDEGTEQDYSEYMCGGEISSSYM